MTVNASSRTPEPKDKVTPKWESWRDSLCSSSDAIRLARSVHLAHLVSKDEHVALLVNSAAKFNLLRRKDDLFDEGVAAIFGIVGGEAGLLGFCFHAGKFTPARAAAWLAERKFTPPVDSPITRRRSPLLP